MENSKTPKSRHTYSYMQMPRLQWLVSLGCDNAFWQRETSFRWGWSLSPRLFFPCLDSSCDCFGQQWSRHLPSCLACKPGAEDPQTGAAALSLCLSVTTGGASLSPSPSCATQTACPPICGEGHNQPSFGLGFKTSNEEHGPLPVPYHLCPNITVTCEMNVFFFSTTVVLPKQGRVIKALSAFPSNFCGILA